MRSSYRSAWLPAVTEASPLHWHWEEVVPGRISASGDFAKMFRGERVKAPGVFGSELLQDESALLMREAVQNSWDAALETRKEAASTEAGLPTPIPFEVRFRLFRRSDGRDCRGVVVVDHRLEVGSASLAVDQEGRIEQQRAHGRCSTCARRRRSKMSDIHWVSGTDRARRFFTSRPDPLDSGTIRATARPCRLTVKSSP